MPSPQSAGHTPQSQGQEPQLSEAWQRPSPQVGHTSQSIQQFVQFSPGSQIQLPHMAGQVPQSRGHSSQLSDTPQAPSPHTSRQGPQSPGQVWQLSW
jgi:hypothetical protein